MQQKKFKENIATISKKTQVSTLVKPVPSVTFGIL